MKIILTIKSILNYLYNNLIDLIWVKKIRFSDGTELDTLPTSATLFDIKRRSIDDISNDDLIQKGWCCISDSQPKRLLKANVPTAYNFLKDKLDNADANIEGWQTSSSNQYIQVFVIDDTNVLIFYDQYRIYKSSISDISDNTKWVQIPLSINCSFALNLTLKIINNLVIFLVNNSLTYNTSIVILDKNTLQEIKILNTDTNDGAEYINYVNGYIYFTCNYYTYRFLYSENPNDINLELVKTINDNYLRIKNIFKYENGYYYLCFLYRESYEWWYRICKTTDIANGEMIIIKQRIKGTTGTPYIYNDNNGNLIYTYNNGTILKSKNMSNWDNSGSWNKSDDWDSISIDFTEYGSQYTTSNSMFNYYSNPNCYIFIYQLTDKDIILYTKDLQNFYLLGDLSGYSINTADTNGQFGIYCWVYNNPQTYYKYSLPNAVPVVYTDTINGIDIKYYKNGDWKICTPDIAVGNDTNLQSVYEYLGYLNYWWIDTDNEQITLQRDTNLWTFMYVGDDYENDSLPNGSYVPYATKNDVGNAGHTIIFKFTGNSGSTLDTEISLGNSCVIFKNGNKLSIIDDYTINGTVITFLTALIPSDKIEVMFGNITSIDLSQYRQKAQVVEIDDASITIDNVSANTNYVFTSNAITDITLTACETSLEETTIQFTTGNSAPTLTDNSGLVWFGGIPTLLPNTTYVIVIFNKQAFYQEQGV